MEMIGGRISEEPPGTRIIFYHPKYGTDIGYPVKRMKISIGPIVSHDGQTIQNIGSHCNRRAIFGCMISTV